jgi:hypothetical protein
MFSMKSTRRLLSASVALAALFAVVLGAGPAAASTGKVGQYSLTDNSTSAGATAKYRYVEDPQDENHWELHRIVVQPPNMKAVRGNKHQTVGWSFTVQRMACFEPPCNQWETRYTSKVFTAVTSDTANAAFTKQSVSVRVPQNPGLYHYRTIVNMFWYRANGSTQGTASARIEWYRQVASGQPDIIDQGCRAAIYSWG